MTDAEAAYFNDRHSEFYLSRYSRAQGRYLIGGKPYRDIRDALRAANRADKRDPARLTFIDVKPALSSQDHPRG